MLNMLLGNEPTRRLSAEGDRGFWPFGGGKTSSGQIVNAETAPKVAAVYACIRVLSETFASAPCITYRRKKSGGKDRATTLPIYSVLHDTPNQWQTAFEFWEMMMFHLCLRGNFYAARIPGALGAVTELIPMHPDRIKVQRLPNGRLRYVFTDPETGQTDEYAQDEIFHVRGMSLDGLLGLSIIGYQKEIIGGTMAADQYANAFFGNDATPGVVLSTDQSLDADARKQTRENWERWHRGADKAHRTAVLANGLKVMQVAVNNVDSQFLETRGYNDSKIASIFRVPPHLIGIMDRATFSNIEQQSLEFIMYTMLPWFRRAEAAITRDLLVDPNLMVEFLVDGLLRGDINSRYTAYNTARNGGWLNGNEIRERENMNDMGPEGDVYLVQGAMMPIDRIINPPEPPAPVVQAPPEVKPVQDAPAPDNADIAKSSDMQDMRPLMLEMVQIVESASDAKVAAIEANAKIEVARERERAEQARAAEVSAQMLKQSAEERHAAISEALTEAREHFESKVAEVGQLSSKMDVMVTGIKKLAADEMRGLIRVEINAMQRASHKHDFLSAIDKFYADQKTRIVESMRQPLSLLETVAGVQHDPESIAATYCDESLAALLDAAGEATEAVLPEKISTLMANWEQRAAFLEV